ncbi:MAG TPA: indolepyruvate oxidoreductase subunit beta [Clostridia bacterium]|nr:indolepyruvate oxidoreductase subunit beta [Clostridia bacterium]
MSRENINILLAGVGGQGTILATKILAHVARTSGYDIKVSEVHGMAQRGGAVVTQVRLGEKVFSPLIPSGEADVIIAFEKLEGLRWLRELKNGGVIVINDQTIEPLPVLVGAAKYPEGAIDTVRSRADKVIAIDALAMAVECGNARTANVVMTGALARLLDMDYEKWQEALEAEVPRFLDMNKKAFEAGYNSVEL